MVNLLLERLKRKRSAIVRGLETLQAFSRMLAPQVRDSAAQLAARFQAAKPFRHWVVDGFFADDAADALLREFPPFERGNARNEQGQLGNKSVVERIGELGNSYSALDELVKSEQFLAWLSQATGIPELRYDPWYFGGGTHENRHGQELDPHIDFNRHPKTGQHRRLNLIVYLNPEWRDDWGGALELHSDPRSHLDQVSLITPLFNRAVLFETTEWSWHGFSKIELPDTRRELSRKSIALYFYTEQRPVEELAIQHSTVYVDRPLPDHYKAGYTLNEADVQELKVMLARRDQHLQRLYHELSARTQNSGMPFVARMVHWAQTGSRILVNLVFEGARWLIQSLHRSPQRASLREAFSGTINSIPEHRRQWLGLQTDENILGAASSTSEQQPPPSSAAPAMNQATDFQHSVPDTSYQGRMEQELANFDDQINVHDLPEIFHYWSNKYLLPILQSFDFKHPEDFFAKYLKEAADRTGVTPPRFVSVGAGNCDAEIRIAADLRQRGLTEFTLECLDINDTMLNRGRQLASDHGLSQHLAFTCCDFNDWQPQAQYAAVMANQSLHHVMDLEGLFDRIRAGLLNEGLFLTSDMIGRNGHQRWPEAKRIVEEYWRQLPDSYRFNLQLQRMETEFLDWDCSSDCFEGIRSQDILPLLLQRFGFEVFIGFGNIVDPFVDRGFGHHFSSEREWDRRFIDEVHARDEAEISAGTISPTHMIAVLTLDMNTVTEHRSGLSPRHCLRPPEAELKPSEADSNAEGYTSN